MNVRMNGNAWKRVSSLGVVAVALTATLVGMTGSADAAGPTGSEACPSNSFCLYYNSPNAWGSFEHWSPATDRNLGGDTFSNWGNGSGYGQVVGGNAAAAVNNTGQTVAVYSGTNCSTETSHNPNPAVAYFAPNTSGQLTGSLYNGAWSFCGD
jgi:hypothetical protein